MDVYGSRRDFFFIIIVHFCTIKVVCYYAMEIKESIVWTVMSTDYYFQEILHGTSFIGLNG